MISPIQFEKSFISLIDQSILNKSILDLKSDGSAVTNLDILIEKELIQFIQKEFNGINIISEESEKSHSNKYNLSKKNFAIIDPIDGTENFYFLKEVYGCVVSVIYKDFEYHGIYIPSRKEIVSNLSIVKLHSSKSQIKLLSTSCLNSEFQLNNNTLSNYRVFGSSSYMFYLMLTNNAFSYTYYGKAKIWDCYTGLSLMYKRHEKFDIQILQKSNTFFDPFDSEFNHFTSFHTQLK